MKTGMLFLLSGFLFINGSWFIGPSAQAENWTEFRGPSGQGHSAATNLPLHWDENKNVAWKIDIPGKGWSSPIVLGDRIFLTTAVLPKGGVGNDRSLRTMCLDAKTGSVRWDVEVFRQDEQTTPHIQGKNSHASPTPITDGKFVYVHFGTKGTACLTLDGNVLWRNKKLVYDPRHGNGGSPVLVDNVLVVSCDGYDIQFVAALDRTSGDIRWKKDRPPTDKFKKFAFSTPLVIKVDGHKQIVSTGANTVAAYDPRDGREIWSVRHPGYSTVPRPVYAHGLVFICSSYDHSHMLAVRPDGHGDVTETHVAWRRTNAVPHTPSLLVIGNDLYAISDIGVLTCCDAKTGNVYWKKRITGKYSASPLFADGRIYLQSEQGVTTVIQPGRKYKQLAQNKLPPRTFASFAVVDSAILIRSERKLYRIQADGTR